MFLNPVELPILFHTDNTLSQSNLGIKYQVTDGIIQDVSFYNIDVVSPYKDGKNDFSTVYSSGQRFVCTMSKEYVDNAIAMNKIDERNEIADDSIFTLNQN